MNTYGYVGGNPAKYSDSLGLAVDPDPNTSGVFRPWLFGTFVHSIFTGHVTSMGYNANTTYGHTFDDFRPDAYDPSTGDVWELKPKTCETSGAPRSAAEAQLSNYVGTANGNTPPGGMLWQKGNSNALFPNGPVTYTTQYFGNNYKITFYPDPVSDSGLVFYSYERGKTIDEKVGDAILESVKKPVIFPLPGGKRGGKRGCTCE